LLKAHTTPPKLGQQGIFYYAKHMTFWVCINCRNEKNSFPELAAELLVLVKLLTSEDWEVLSLEKVINTGIAIGGPPFQGNLRPKLFHFQGSS